MRVIISLMYFGIEVDGVGVSRVEVSRDKGLDRLGTFNTIDTTSSTCLLFLSYAFSYLIPLSKLEFHHLHSQFPLFSNFLVPS